jgi:hypothetical protein
MERYDPDADAGERLAARGRRSFCAPIFSQRASTTMAHMVDEYGKDA